MEGWREGGSEGWREGGREGGRQGEREGEKEGAWSMEQKVGQRSAGRHVWHAAGHTPNRILLIKTRLELVIAHGCRVWESGKGTGEAHATWIRGWR